MRATQDHIEVTAYCERLEIHKIGGAKVAEYNLISYYG